MKFDCVVDFFKFFVKGNFVDIIYIIDYFRIDKWDEEVCRIIEGKGVNFVIEIGGRGIIGKSIRSIWRGGFVVVLGKSGFFFKIIVYFWWIGYFSIYKDIFKEILEEDLV